VLPSFVFILSISTVSSHLSRRNYQPLNMISKLVTAAALAMPLAQAMPATLEAREDKIVGGEPASLGEFPFLVALTQNGGIWCGGSLVNANTVITAAHCSDVSPDSMTVVAGTVVSTRTV
jgi:trypsin